MKKIRSAVIGLGHIATKFHLPAILKSKKFNIVSVCDNDFKKFKRVKSLIKNTKFYLDYKIMLKKEVFDTIFIFTPPNQHFSQILDSIKFKKNIFVEKPVVIKNLQLNKIKKRIKSHNSYLQCALHQRFRPISKEIKKIINSKKLGDIYFVNIVHKKFRAVPKHSFVFSDKNKSGGGPLIDLGTHYFDLAAWIFNFPKINSMKCHLFSNIFKNRKNNYLPHNYFNNEESAIGNFVINNRILINFELSYISNSSNEEIKIEFYGTKGSVIWPKKHYFKLVKNKLIKKPIKFSEILASNQQIDNFYKRAIKKDSSVSNLNEYTYVVKLVNNLYNKSKRFI